MGIMDGLRSALGFGDAASTPSGAGPRSVTGRGRGSLRGYVNEVTGLGTDRDKAAAGHWAWKRIDREQLDKIYRSNWIARKVVDVPALDMMRGGWQWTAEPDVQKKLDEECKRLGIAMRVSEALKWARLYGGAGIYLADGAEDVSEPLNVEAIKEGGLQFATTLPRYFLKSARTDLDPISPHFGEATSYTIGSAAEGAGNVHPSRVVRFIGNDVPTFTHIIDDEWGDSVLEVIEQTIRDYTAGQRGIANLIQEASVDVIGVEGMMANITNRDYQQALVNRTRMAMDMKSTMNALIKDNADTYEQKTANFGGLPETVRLLLQIVAGAADIPATRLLGQSPDGMNATGDGDLRNYYDRIEAERDNRLCPALDKVFDVVIRSALGERPDEIDYTFTPLWQMDEKELAEIEERKAKTLQTYAVAGVMPEQVLAKLARSAVTSNETAWPGAPEAYEGVSLDGPSGPPVDLDDGLLEDAAPRTLYVHRKVLNGRQILNWAKKQGFGETLKAADLHVTIAYSRQPVDWMKAGQVWGASDLKVQAGGPRLVEPLGDKGAIVLLFSSSDLSWRHEDIKRRSGATFTHESYQPHMTITYKGGDVDLSKVEPYRGEIKLGPEVFEEVDDAWAEKLEDQ